MASALITPFAQSTLQITYTNQKQDMRNLQSKEFYLILTSTLPTTPASSKVSLEAASSIDSSISQPP